MKTGLMALIVSVLLLSGGLLAESLDPASIKAYEAMLISAKATADAGDKDQANRILDRAAAYSRWELSKMQSPRKVTYDIFARRMMDMAELNIKTGRKAVTDALLSEALSLAEKTSYDSQSLLLPHIAEIKATAGDKQGAGRIADQAVLAARQTETGEGWRVASLVRLAKIRAGIADRQGGLALLDEALSVATNISDTKDRVMSLAEVANTLESLGQTDKMLAIYDGLFKEKPDFRNLEDAERWEEAKAEFARFKNSLAAASSVPEPQTSQTSAPADFSVEYHWHSGSMPPPHYYGYTITIQPSGMGSVSMFPPSPPPHPSPSKAGSISTSHNTFSIGKEDRDKLYRLMVDKGLLSEKWEKMIRPPVGGSYQWLKVTATTKQVEIPAFPIPAQQDRAREVCQAITALVPQEIWDGMDAERRAAVQQGENESMTTAGLYGRIENLLDEAKKKLQAGDKTGANALLDETAAALRQVKYPTDRRLFLARMASMKVQAGDLRNAIAAYDKELDFNSYDAADVVKARNTLAQEHPELGIPQRLHNQR